MRMIMHLPNARNTNDKVIGEDSVEWEKLSAIMKLPSLVHH